MTIANLTGQSTLAALAARPTVPAQSQIPAANFEKDAPSFADRLGDALDKVNEAQSKAATSATQFETGQTENLASVMVDQQVASLGFQMTLNVRNKALNAYQDIMNMPV